MAAGFIIITILYTGKSRCDVPPIGLAAFTWDSQWLLSYVVISNWLHEVGEARNNIIMRIMSTF